MNQSSKSIEKHITGTSGVKAGCSGIKDRTVRQDSKQKRGSSKRRQQPQTQQSHSQTRGGGAGQIRALDQHLAQATGAPHPVFSPKGGSQSAYNNYMVLGGAGAQLQTKKKVPAQQHFFNQTTSLVGLSNHLMLLGSGEDVDTSNMATSLEDDESVQQVVNRRKTSTRGAIKPHEIQGMQYPLGQQQQQYFSETQNIDFSSLQSHSKLIPQYYQQTNATSRTKKKSGSSVKKHIGMVQQQNVLNHHLNLDPLILQQGAPPRASTRDHPQSTKNLKNEHPQHSLQQQARLDELISHVKAAAAAVTGYQTNAGGPHTIIGSTVSQASSEKAVNSSTITLKRKPSTQVSKKSLPHTIEVKRMSSAIKKKGGTSVVRDANNKSIEQCASTKRQSTQQESLNLGRGLHQNALGSTQQQLLLQNLNGPVNPEQINQLTSLNYKNLTQKIIREQHSLNSTQQTTKPSINTSKKSTSCVKTGGNNVYYYQGSVPKISNNMLNQTQVISSTSGLTTTTNKGNQKSFGFEMQVPSKKRSSQKSTGGMPVGKKAMNLTGTLPKGLLSPSLINQQKGQYQQYHPSSVSDHNILHYQQSEMPQSFSTHQSYQNLQSQPSGVNLRNTTANIVTTNHTGQSNGQQQQPLPTQNIIYSDIRDYNVINTYIGCFPPQGCNNEHVQNKQERTQSNDSGSTQQQKQQQVMIKNYKTQLLQQQLQNQQSLQSGPPPPVPMKKKRHQKNSTLPNAAVLLLNELLLQNNALNLSSQLVTKHSSKKLSKEEQDPIELKPRPAVLKTAGYTPRGCAEQQPRAVSGSNQQMIKQVVNQQILKNAAARNSSVKKHQASDNLCYDFNAENEEVGIEFTNQQDKLRTVKLTNISKILGSEYEEDIDLQVTSGCGVISSSKQSKSQVSKKMMVPTSQSSGAIATHQANASITANSNQNQKPSQQQFIKQINATQQRLSKRRQRSHSNGSSSAGSISADIRSRSLGRVTAQEEQLQYPITPAKALKLFMNHMTDHEKGEILDYKQIYFLGVGSSKLKGSPLHPYNFGYDDERGDYKVVMKDHIAYRFEVLEFLGKGSFGQALKCFDHKTQEMVAIKLIRNKKRFQHQAGVELKILMHLKQNDPDDGFNIIRIKDYVVFRKHLVISFELFSINLYDFIKNNNFQGVSLSLIRRFAIQILQALKYLREQSIIHCDLKPENILLKSPDKSGIKVIDFGSSCFQDERIYTYIQSRFYRAPEIILGIPYTPAIDMWSLGCILVELFTGYPLFPGETEQEQLSLIMEVRGQPAEWVLDQSSRRKIFFDDQTDEPLLLSQDSQGRLRIPGTKPLPSLMRCQSATFVDFIERCLDWDPQTRLNPYEALLHDWIIEGLPPKVLIHHKRMLGVYEDKVSRDGGESTSPSLVQNNQQFKRQFSNGARQLKPTGAQIKAVVKEKLMNRTCMISDALKSVNDDELKPLMNQNAFQNQKSQLNKTGIIVLNEREDLMQYDNHSSDNGSTSLQGTGLMLFHPQPKNNNPQIFKMPPIVQQQQAINIQMQDQQNYYDGDNPKSKTTNMTDFLHQIKKQPVTKHPGSASGVNKVNLDNTYDISKLKKNSFLSQNEGEQNEDCEDYDEGEVDPLPFDERQQMQTQESSHLKKQQKSKIPFNFLVQNYFKTSGNAVRPKQGGTNAVEEVKMNNYFMSNQ